MIYETSFLNPLNFGSSHACSHCGAVLLCGEEQSPKLAVARSPMATANYIRRLELSLQAPHWRQRTCSLWTVREVSVRSCSRLRQVEGECSSSCALVLVAARTRVEFTIMWAW